MENHDKYFEEVYDAVKEMVENGIGRCVISREFGISSYMATKWIDIVKTQLVMRSSHEKDLAEQEKLTHTMNRQAQRLMDSNRILRKTSRATSRILNAVEEYDQQLIKILEENDLSNFTVVHESDDSAPFIIMHISDAHFNELVSLPNNKYDFNVASSRLKAYTDRCRNIAIAHGATDVLIAMTGDMMNSDRRLDELLSESTNRSKATFIAVDILQQLILDINQHFNVFVAYVTGNESRITKDIGWSAEVASDNYDTTIFNILKYLFKGSESITFIDGDPVELVVSLNGVNVLLLHGNGAIKSNVEESVAKVIGRYAAQNVVIDYVIFGHKHSAYLGDKFSRSSSLVGANSYSEFCVNACARASQNMYVVHECGAVDAIKIDLQNIHSPGYDISESLIDHDAKSVMNQNNACVVKAVKPVKSK